MIKCYSLVEAMRKNLKCVVKNCCTNYCIEDANKRMFCFPRERNRCEKWVDFCQNSKVTQLFLSGKLMSFTYLRVCSLHFSRESFTNELKNRLLPVAVPAFMNESKAVSTSSSITYPLHAKVTRDIPSNTSQSIPSNTPQPQPIPSKTLQSQPIPTNTPQSQPIPTNTPQPQPIPSKTLQSQSFPTNTPQSQPIPSNTPQSKPILSYSPPSVLKSSVIRPSLSSVSSVPKTNSRPAEKISGLSLSDLCVTSYKELTPRERELFLYAKKREKQVKCLKSSVRKLKLLLKKYESQTTPFLMSSNNGKE